jgi:monoamine oxidase
VNNLMSSGSNPVPTGIELDVAIVGGGVSGLYTGYRLCTGPFTGGGGPPASIGLFESSDRLGGRLESVVLPGMEIAGELGGMRYMTSQKIATTLIEDVFKDELQHVDFPMGEEDHRLFYLRTQRFLANSWKVGQESGTPFRTNYELNAGDVGFSPEQLFNKVVYDVLMADPEIARAFGSKMKQSSSWNYEINLTSEDWDAIKPVVRYTFAGSPYNGMLVNDMGFWNLLKDQCSQEGYDFLADGGGYYSNTINWNAAEAFENMVGDFTGTDVAYRTIVGGYDRIAGALADHLAEEPRATIWTDARLVRVDRSVGTGWRYSLTIQNQPGGAPVQVLANAVVLALPRRSLELLDQDCFLFNDEGSDTPTALAEALPSVLLQPSFKLLMGFEEPWWKDDLGASSGESITDLPMRQCYYFGTDPSDSHSLFLGSYNDMDTVSFWSALQQAQAKLFIPHATALADADAVAELAEFQAPQIMVDEGMKQIRELHGPEPKPIPDPYITYYKDWGEDPFGGGYHAWAAAVPVQQAMLYMRQPLGSETIHVCGEAYSDLQGWIEGAFCVAEHMLQEHFGMEWPAWLEKGYYLGW